MPNLKTAESVSPKHPDKLCDRISDTILDAYLTEDPDSRVAVDVAGGHGVVFVTGEVSSQSKPIDIEKIVRNIAGNVKVIVKLSKQSPEISRGVDIGGAGDQGIMVGYATSETPELLPLEVVLARSLNQFLYQRWPFDGKTQVTIWNREIYSIVASFQNAKSTELEEAVREWARQQTYVNPSFVKYRNSDPTLHINPAGEWQIGGFDADAGLTGRKLVVDNYGPRIPLGGGAFSGKDPSKVDRSAAYMARRIAVDYLERFQADEVLVRLAYAIGYDQPIETTAIVDGVERKVEGYDLSPNGIIERLDLKRPIYAQTAKWGHFGHTEFSWNKSLKVHRE